MAVEPQLTSIASLQYVSQVLPMTAVCCETLPTADRAWSCIKSPHASQLGQDTQGRLAAGEYTSLDRELNGQQVTDNWHYSAVLYSRLHCTASDIKSLLSVSHTLTPNSTSEVR